MHTYVTILFFVPDRDNGLDQQWIYQVKGRLQGSNTAYDTGNIIMDNFYN